MKTSWKRDTEKSPATLRLDYSRSFLDEKADAIEYLLSRGNGDVETGIDLERFESCILIKNSDRILVHANSAFRNLIAYGQLLIGTSTDAHLGSELRVLSQTTDDLIIRGLPSIELEHVADIGRDHRYRFVTYKRRLDELADSNLCFLVICRPLEIVSDVPEQRRRSLSEQLMVFRRLDEIDQQICRMYYHGESTKTIAQSVNLTTRSVEMRRQKTLDAFGFKRPVEIIKLLAVLEEHAMIRLLPK